MKTILYQCIAMAFLTAIVVLVLFLFIAACWVVAP